MRENRTYGLEGGEVILPDPYRYNDPHFVTEEFGDLGPSHPNRLSFQPHLGYG